MANDKLFIVCKKCLATTTLYSYYPGMASLSAQDVRGFVEAHVDVCFFEANMDANISVQDLGDDTCFEIHTEKTYADKWGQIPAKEAIKPDGSWRKDPPEAEDVVETYDYRYKQKDNP